MLSKSMQRVSAGHACSGKDFPIFRQDSLPFLQLLLAVLLVRNKTRIVGAAIITSMVVPSSEYVGNTSNRYEAYIGNYLGLYIRFRSVANTQLLVQRFSRLLSIYEPWSKSV